MTNSLATIAPKLAREWHPSRNKPLEPDKVVAGSAKWFWWRCPVGHEFRMRPQTRVRGTGACPVCKPRRRRVVTRKVTRKRVILPSDPS